MIGDTKHARLTQKMSADHIRIQNRMQLMEGTETVSDSSSTSSGFKNQSKIHFDNFI